MLVKIIIAGLILAFYFLSIKPQKDAAACQEEARQKAIAAYQVTDYPDDDKRQSLQADYQALYLNDCLGK